MSHLIFLQRRFFLHFAFVFTFIFTLSSTLYADINPENVLGINCLASYQDTYLKLKDSKVFVYARERNTDEDTCAWSYGRATLEEAAESALKECEGKVKSKCELIDKNGEFIVKRSQFSHLEPLDNTELVSEDRLALMTQAKPLVKGNCLPFFSKYLSAKGHKSFGYSIDAEGNYACGYSYNNQTKMRSEKRALKSCEDNVKQRGKKKPKAACKVFASSFNILLSAKDYGLDENSLDKQSFLAALHKGNVKKVKAFIDQGTDINMMAKDGMTPLFLAASKGNDEWFYELIAKGADLKHKMNDGSDILIAAVFGESPDIIRYLLKNGFDIDSKGRDGNRPIHIAFRRLNTYLIKLLIREGADLSLKNDKGVSALEKITKAKIDIDKAKQIKPNELEDGFYPLFNAVKYGDLMMIKTLVKKGADINKIEKYGMSPYSMAKNKATIQLLHKLGADINHQDDEGETALMYNADDLEKVKTLLALKADKTLKDKKGNTAYDKIKNRKTVKDEIKQLLKL